jgi:hypothetical protein
MAVHKQTLRTAFLVLKVRFALANVRHVGMRAVVVGRREVRQHTRPIDALPQERVVRKLVELIP